MLEEAVPCSICGKRPIMHGGIKSHEARLVCPNYRSEEIQHGNLNIRTKGIARGFTDWNHMFWTEEQAKESTKELVKEWNEIHKNKK